MECEHEIAISVHLNEGSRAFHFETSHTKLFTLRCDHHITSGL